MHVRICSHLAWFLFEMATGQRGFNGDTTAILHDSILHHAQPLARELNPELPIQLEEVIRKALEKDRELRFQSAAEMRSGLKSTMKSIQPKDQTRIAEASPATADPSLPSSNPKIVGALASFEVEATGQATIERRTHRQGWSWRRRLGTLAGVCAACAPLVHRSNWSRRWMLASVLLLIVVAGITMAFRTLRHPKVLTEKDTVVLADFVNTTGDPVFDGTLRQGLSVQLEQSPFLSIVSEGRIQQTLKMMGQPADAKLTRATARELCQRMGSAAVLDGSIAQIGSRYLLTLTAVNLHEWRFAGEHGSSDQRQEPCARCFGKDRFRDAEQAGRVAWHCAEV
jgi:eukaryotic-like serine/threonine-protein kinase